MLVFKLNGELTVLLSANGPAWLQHPLRRSSPLRQPGAAPFSVRPGAPVTLGEGVAPELAALDVQHAHLHLLRVIFYSVLLPPQIKACFSENQMASWPAFIIYECSILNLGSPD